MPTKGICLIWSRGRLFSPSLSCRGQGIGKHRGTTSSWHKRTAGRNLVVHRHGTTLRRSVQRYRCRLYFSLFFSHFDIKAGEVYSCVARSFRLMDKVIFMCRALVSAHALKKGRIGHTLYVKTYFSIECIRRRTQNKIAFYKYIGFI